MIILRLVDWEKIKISKLVYLINIMKIILQKEKKMYLKIVCWKVKAIDTFELALDYIYRIMNNLIALNIIKCQKIFFNKITFSHKIYFLELKILEKRS